MTRPAPLLLLLAGLLFFLALGNHELQGSTEARVSGIAMAMHLDNDWVVPQLFREPFLEKPPLSLWLDAGAIRLFGGTPGAVRLASAFAGLFSVMLLYGMLRRFGRPKTLAFCAALILATMASYWGNVRGVGEDSLLSLGVTTALLAFYQAVRPGREASSAWAWMLFTAGMVIATLSKGVLGLALPGIVIFVYLTSISLMDKRLRIGEWLKPGVFTVLALVPLMIWLGFLFQRGGMQAVGEVLWTNSVGRFSGSFVEAGHYEPFYYYFAKLPQAFLPWNILVYLGLWHFRKKPVARSLPPVFQCLAGGAVHSADSGVQQAHRLPDGTHASRRRARSRICRCAVGMAQGAQAGAVPLPPGGDHRRVQPGNGQLPDGCVLVRTQSRQARVFRTRDQSGQGVSN